MELHRKLKILSDAAKYDVSCSSSGSKRKNTPGGMGNASQAGICHSWTEDGRCVSLLKILYSNACIYDCVYCTNRRSKDRERATFTPREVVELTLNFYKRNYIEGLFLSSGVLKNPDYTMEQMIEVVKKLRETNFNGYIHLKGIPGADPFLVHKAGEYVDRMSVNIEFPSEKSLLLLAPQKERRGILQPMNLLERGIRENREEHRSLSQKRFFLPAGQSTQLIVGASPENDRTIIRLTEGLYHKYQLKRVYYSAYIPTEEHSLLPSIQSKPPLLREHRLYQADWLLRFYGFKAEELLGESNPNFDLNLDPKCFWALQNFERFPMEINLVSYDVLLRIPGIGVRSAMKILRARKIKKLSFEDLKKMGVVLKRAKYFILCNGKYHGGVSLYPDNVRAQLLGFNKNQGVQLSIFDQQHQRILKEEEKSKVMGGF